MLTPQRPKMSFIRMPSRAALAALASAAIGLAPGVALGNAGNTARVSVDTTGGDPNGRCGNVDDNVSISSDARYVAFDADATDLVSGDTNLRTDVFVRDRLAETTVRASVSSEGTEGNGNSTEPVLSPNGRFVAFRSGASNLVSGDSNASEDIFVRDLVSGTTVRVSESSAGAQANGPSFSLALSSDGRYVAFGSLATNLVSNDTNNSRDVFVRDRDADGDGLFDEVGVVSTTRVSLSSLGVAGDGDSGAPAISADGRYVAFDSDAGNLVTGDLNDLTDVFVHDRQVATTTRISVSTSGADANGNSLEPSMSGAGRFVAFQSAASNLVTGDTNGAIDVFVRDRQSSTTARVSVSSSGTQGNFLSNDPSISPDGSFVAFRSLADNLVADDTNSRADVFVFNGQDATTTRASLDSAGAQGNLNSSDPSVSMDGRLVVFSSLASNLIASDGNGAIDVFVRDLVDAVPPVITCSPDLTLECVSSAGAVATFDVTAVDVCDPSPTLICVPASGSTFSIGTTTVNCTATDHSTPPNSSMCSFTVSVRDTTPPVMTCPGDISTECTGPSGATVSYTTPSATDVCDPSPTVNCVPASGSAFALGMTLVTCTASDHAIPANTFSCSFTVTVNDTIPPTIGCPSNITAECTSAAGVAVSFSVTAEDVCDASPAVVCVPASGSTFPIGTTPVNCTASDDGSPANTSNCSFTVTVRDTTAPSMSCPANVTLDCTGPSGAVATYTTPTATDACDPSPTVNCSPASGSTFPIGSTTVTCTATDHASPPNSSSCGFSVVVRDTTPPTLTCPGNVTVECTGPSGSVVTFTTPTASDNCDLSPTVSCVPASGSAFPLGTTTVTCTARDHATPANLQTCTFSVRVVDTLPPVMQCPSPVTAECTGPSGAVVTFTVTALDVCDPTPTVLCTPASGSTFPFGPTTVNCAAADDSQNVAICSFQVRVVDTTPPAIQCPSNVTTECTSTAGATVTFSAVALDSCDTSPSIACVPPSGSSFLVGTTQVLCTATDDSRNASTCTFTVTVEDFVPPVVHCPTDVSASCQAGSGAIVTFTPTATDNCDPDPDIVCVPASGSLFPIGTSTVVCTATDDGANASQCSFAVTVGDVTITAVVPATGSETGGDLTKINGCGFTDVADTTVLFGGAAATVVDVTLNRIKVRTPPGTGIVSVTVTNSIGSSTLPSAYRYLDPVLAARLGNVNVIIGDREDVLTINGSIGDENRELEVAVRQSISIFMDKPSNRPGTSRYAFYGWFNASGPGTLKPQPFGLGTMIFPTPLTPACLPQPRAIWNNAGFEHRLGQGTFPSSPAPSEVIRLPNGLPGPLTLSFQGFIRDNGSQIPQGFSITNAITLRVRP